MNTEVVSEEENKMNTNKNEWFCTECLTWNTDEVCGCDEESEDLPNDYEWDDMKVFS